MKRKFYFHRQNSPLDSDHVIYVLWVGESVREQKILTQLVAWSFQHGATLMSWDESIDYYLLLESERVFPGKGLLDFGFQQTNINARELQILMEDNSFESYEAALTTPKQFFTQLVALDPLRIDKPKAEIKSINVLSSQRKYLSERASTKPTIISFI